MKLKDYILYWFRMYRMPRQRPSTQESMLSIIEKHINVSKLGDMDLTEITTKDVQEFLTEQFLTGNRGHLKHRDLRGQPLSAHTIVKMRQILISMFRQAVNEDMVSKNVAEFTTRISLPWHESSVFTPEMQRQILERAKNHRFYVAYVLLFYLGCRRSEILGLSWNNVNFEENLLTIRQALVREYGQLVLRQRTKTRNSIRSIPFPDEIKALLLQVRARQEIESQAPGYSNVNNLIFCNKDGSFYNPAYFSRNFKSLVQRLDGCPKDLHIHSTRHTWATNMVHLGVGITDIQAMGGWSRPDTLLNIYAHTVKEAQVKAICKLYQEIH